MHACMHECMQMQRPEHARTRRQTCVSQPLHHHDQQQQQQCQIADGKIRIDFKVDLLMMELHRILKIVELLIYS